MMLYNKYLRQKYGIDFYR